MSRALTTPQEGGHRRRHPEVSTRRLRIATERATVRWRARWLRRTEVGCRAGSGHPQMSCA
eukprot:scaffold8788_cov108-Isochrysis_galbana.AAC.9